VVNQRNALLEHSDVLIVGAGLSGVGAAHYLKQECPWASVRLLEARDRIGGTWDIFRYPGIRADSDMFTLGYDFKPWRGGKVLADGPAIRSYVQETAEEAGIDRRIRFGHRVLRADWSTGQARWTVTALDLASGEERRFSCGLLYLCAGYYSYEHGHTPDFPGREDFSGTVVHPQFWPEDLDYSGKRVVVIGSGATAVTLVPAIAGRAAKVTMLQRSPTYIFNRPEHDALGRLLGRFLPSETAYRATRWVNFRMQWLIYSLTRLFPARMKRFFINRARAALPDGYDVDTHFTPSYNPWDQRLCAVPENDLFHSIASGDAEVVTDHIERFTEGGIALESGRELEADIIVTATGLELVMAGEVEFSLDGQAHSLGDSYSYKGVMFSDVPNLVNVFGYVNYSWTLRADLIARFTCRLLQRMHRDGVRQVTPRLRPEDRGMPKRPFVDDFSAGYVARAIELLPKQGDREPWINCQNYIRERRTIGAASLDDGVLCFDNPQPVQAAPEALSQTG
jgi:cation diffusion facilitator CzcD-associated flavoprotein CzcO